MKTWEEILVDSPEVVAKIQKRAIENINRGFPIRRCSSFFNDFPGLPNLTTLGPRWSNMSNSQVR